MLQDKWLWRSFAKFSFHRVSPLQACECEDHAQPQVCLHSQDPPHRGTWEHCLQLATGSCAHAHSRAHARARKVEYLMLFLLESALLLLLQRKWAGLSIGQEVEGTLLSVWLLWMMISCGLHHATHLFNQTWALPSECLMSKIASWNSLKGHWVMF